MSCDQSESHHFELCLGAASHPDGSFANPCHLVTVCVSISPKISLRPTTSEAGKQLTGESVFMPERSSTCSYSLHPPPASPAPASSSKLLSDSPPFVVVVVVCGVLPQRTTYAGASVALGAAPSGGAQEPSAAVLTFPFFWLLCRTLERHPFLLNDFFPIVEDDVGAHSSCPRIRDPDILFLLFCFFLLTFCKRSVYIPKFRSSQCGNVWQKGLLLFCQRKVNTWISTCDLFGCDSKTKTTTQKKN
jgi:hypothetical protein